MPNRFYIPDKTWDLEKKPHYDKFMKDYIEVLQREFKRVEVKAEIIAIIITHVGNPMIREIQIGNPSKYYGSYANQMDMTRSLCKK